MLDMEAGIYNEIFIIRVQVERAISENVLREYVVMIVFRFRVG